MVRYGDEKDGTSWHTSISIWFVRLFDAIHANSASPQTERLVTAACLHFITKASRVFYDLCTGSFFWLYYDNISLMQSQCCHRRHLQSDFRYWRNPAVTETHSWRLSWKNVWSKLAISLSDRCSGRQGNLWLCIRRKHKKIQKKLRKPSLHRGFSYAIL